MLQDVLVDKTTALAAAEAKKNGHPDNAPARKAYANAARLFAQAEDVSSRGKGIRSVFLLVWPVADAQPLAGRVPCCYR